MKDVTIPIVHINGTSHGELEMNSYLMANSVSEAIDTLNRLGPNPRDYYPLGEKVWRKAQAEHLDRINRLREVYTELKTIYDKITELP